MNETDRQIVEQAMKDTRTLELADRSVDQLSGGQRQRVWIAMSSGAGYTAHFVR